MRTKSASSLPEPVDGEHEVGDLPVVAKVLELHLGGEISDQRDYVHAFLPLLTEEATLAEEMCRHGVGFVPAFNRGAQI